MAGLPGTGGYSPPSGRQAGRRPSWTNDKRQVFLALLSTCLNVKRALDVVGLSDSSAYQLKRRDPEFARQWAEALDQGYHNLELEMLRQSIEGCERTETVRETPKGRVKQVKIIHSYPHNVAMRLLQAHREEVRAFRLARAEQDEDGAVAAQVRAHMDLVRGRLVAQGIVADEAPQPEEQAQGDAREKGSVGDDG